MKPIIEVKSVWKEYPRGVDRKYKSLRDTISGFSENWFREKTEKFWALTDINFSLNEGESFGIIGRNGAGKSTLLKILSRITPPTKGEIVLRGRVSGLLEVGTGFHPELTGRENIFFNGSVIGMSYKEIKAKFDDIVDFSGISSFIDSPLKHYSSGMQMRLAFSVASHLQSEIFIIDEVLAVGDIEFQKKCIEKIKTISSENGKTIIFVTHDINVLKNLCQKSMLISAGKLSLISNTQEVLNQFYKENNILANQELNSLKRSSGNQEVFISGGKIWQVNKNNEHFIVQSLSDINIEIEIQTSNMLISKEIKLDLGINGALGQRLTWISTTIDLTLVKNPGSKSVLFKIHSFPFVPGTYDCNIHVSYNGIVADWLKNVLTFTVVKGDHNDMPSDQGNVLLNYTVQ